MIAMITAIAYDLLSRDDIFELHATRDAAELADHLINTAPTDLLPTDLCNDDFDIMIASLRSIMSAMILNPID